MLRLLSIASLFLSASSAALAAPQSAVILDTDNFVRLSGEISDKAAGQFISDILLKQHEKSLTIYIDSGGGSVLAGARIVQTVRDLKKTRPALKVRCYSSLAASMAFVILQTVCDDRVVGEVSTLMQHQATFGVEGRDGEVQSRLGMISSFVQWMDSLQASRLGLSVRELRDLSRDEWWLVGEQAVKAKAADRVSPILCTPDLVKGTHEESFQNMFVRAKLTWSDCPLIQYPLKIEADNKAYIPLIQKHLEERKLQMPK